MMKRILPLLFTCVLSVLPSVASTNNLTFENLWILDRTHTPEAFASSGLATNPLYNRTATILNGVVFVAFAGTEEEPVKLYRFNALTGEPMTTLTVSTGNWKPITGLLSGLNIGKDDYGHLWLIPWSVESSNELPVYTVNGSNGYATLVTTLPKNLQWDQTKYADVIGDITREAAPCKVAVMNSNSSLLRVLMWDAPQGGSFDSYARIETLADWGTGRMDYNPTVHLLNDPDLWGECIYDSYYGVPTYNESGSTIEDSEYESGSTIEDSEYESGSTIEDSDLMPTKSANGVVTFSLCGRKFMAYAYRDYINNPGVQAKIVELDDFSDFSTMSDLWTIPDGGFGSHSDGGNRVNSLDVEIKTEGTQEVAYLEFFKSNNGLAVYRIACDFGDDIIAFRSASTKAACVRHYDTNGDGELSYREANAVTSLAFTAADPLDYFDEFQYFTGLKRVPQNAFAGVTTLCSITLPSTATVVGEDAFAGCTALTSVVLPEKLTELGAGAFRQCSSLQAIVLPKRTTHIGREAFADCSALTSVTLGATGVDLGERSFAGCVELKDFDLTRVSIIGRQTFAGTGMTSVDVPENVYGIGQYAFSNADPTAALIVTLYGGGIIADEEEEPSDYDIHLPQMTEGTNTTLRVPIRLFHAFYQAEAEPMRDKLLPFIYHSNNNYCEGCPVSCEVPLKCVDGEAQVYMVNGFDFYKEMFTTQAIWNRVVPANTGVIVKGYEAGKPYFLARATFAESLAATASVNHAANLLRPCIEDVDYLLVELPFSWACINPNWLGTDEPVYCFMLNEDAVTMGCAGGSAWMDVPRAFFEGSEVDLTNGNMFEVEFVEPIPTDINGDRVVDVTDLNILVNVILGILDITEFPLADVNCDQVVDVADLNHVINFVLAY